MKLFGKTSRQFLTIFNVNILKRGHCNKIPYWGHFKAVLIHFFPHTREKKNLKYEWGCLVDVRVYPPPPLNLVLMTQSRFLHFIQ